MSIYIEWNAGGEKRFNPFPEGSVRRWVALERMRRRKSGLANRRAFAKLRR